MDKERERHIDIKNETERETERHRVTKEAVEEEKDTEIQRMAHRERE